MRSAAMIRIWLPGVISDDEFGMITCYCFQFLLYPFSFFLFPLQTITSAPLLASAVAVVFPMPSVEPRQE